MEEISCVVCFGDFDNNEQANKCMDNNCNIYICTECLEMLITHSCRDNILPKCPGNKCDLSYTLSCMKNINPTIVKTYELGCLDYFMKSNGDIVKKKITERNIILNLRQERLQFIEQKYPKGITLVAKIAFNDKLKKLDKQKQEIINLTLKNSKKPCINNICNGFLDDKFECMSCTTKFCAKCERALNNNHECNKHDLDSINLINDMIRCPTCKLPVFKNEGCDNITCSNCQTKFKYSTGQIGGSGSHNAKIVVNIGAKKLLSVEHRNILTKEELELILKIESLEPSIMSKNTLLTPIKTFIQNPSLKTKCAKILAKKIDAFTKSIYKSKNYNKCIVMINNLIMNKNEHNLIDKLNEIIILI